MPEDRLFAGISSTLEDAAVKITDMNVQVAETIGMAQSTAPQLSQLTSRQRSRAQTPYHPETWGALHYCT